ncbi:MAG: deoxyhypusine synthase [Candidatus Anstonellales archaeon]
MKKADYLKKEIEHIDIKMFDATPIIRQYEKMAFQARNLARACHIYEKMLKEKECTIILCLAGSLISAGLKKAIYDLVDNNMIDVIVATGANIVDQDFFEALGFKHYIGTPNVNDDDLYRNHIDRIYDTYIDEDQLRVCDETIAKIADSLDPKPYSSQEFIVEMGKYLVANNIGKDSIVRRSYEKGVPIFCPAFSDSSAGFGLVHHQYRRGNRPKVTIDVAKDFLDLTRIKIASKVSGLLMLAGGVPKNFAQDTVVAAEVIGKEVTQHKYAIQITVADERDGGLSGSTLKEAHSWGKVDVGNEQMVFSEVTLAFPILASYAYHSKAWIHRKEMRFNDFLKNAEF